MRRPLLAFIGVLVCGVVAVAPAAGVRRADAEARRHGRLSARVHRAPVSQRLLTSCWIRWRTPELDEGPRAAHSRSGPTSRCGQTSCPASTHGAATVHADVSHPARGALERRRPGHRPGLRLHPRGHPWRDYEDPEPAVTPRSERACSIAKTVRVVLRRRFAAWRAAVSGTSCRRHALAGEDVTKVWSDRIDNPKSGRPIGSGPFLVARWDRGRQLDAPAQSALLGAACRLISTGSSSAS